MSAENHAPNHDYHLVDPSPWPFVGSWSAFVLAIGAVWMFHPDMMLPGLEGLGIWKIVPGFVLVLFTMFSWWKAVLDEAGQGHHKPVVQLAMRYGMSLFIASEVMFFVAFFWAFFDASFYYNEAKQVMRIAITGGEWPPVNIETFDPWHLPFMNTLILLLSGCTVTWAHHALREGKNEQVVQGLAISVILGVCFTALQAYEYSHAAFGFTEGIYASVFYMATGFHGFHVLVGTIFLAVCLVRAYRGSFTPTAHFGFEAAAWYWHFVDVVWLFLFVAVYWWAG